MVLTKIEEKAKAISNFRALQCTSLTDIFIPQLKILRLIQFDLLDVYNKWNPYFGKKDLSFSRFLNIYLNDLLLIYALKESILSLNRLDFEKEKHKNPIKEWQKMNLKINSYEPVYHLVSLTLYLKINYERLLFCLEEQFKCKKSDKSEKRKKAIIDKMTSNKIDNNFIKVIESIDIKKLNDYRCKIEHHSGLCFQEFFTSANNNLDFDQYLEEMMMEIRQFYNILQKFVKYSTFQKPKYNLMSFASPSKEELDKWLKQSNSNPTSHHIIKYK